jgi:putative Holliday junction resolvase
MATRQLMALDIGHKRIGVALGDTAVRIAIPYDTIAVDGSELRQVAQLYTAHSIDTIIVGYPRNQQGEPTEQTAYVEAVAEDIAAYAKIVFQDESLTSVHAEQRLASRKKNYSKSDIDAEAAAIILQDYLEEKYG